MSYAWTRMPRKSHRFLQNSFLNLQPFLYRRQNAHQILTLGRKIFPRGIISSSQRVLSDYIHAACSQRRDGLASRARIWPHETDTFFLVRFWRYNIIAIVQRMHPYPDEELILLSDEDHLGIKYTIISWTFNSSCFFINSEEMWFPLLSPAILDLEVIKADGFPLFIIYKGQFFGKQSLERSELPRSFPSTLFPKEPLSRIHDWGTKSWPLWDMTKEMIKTIR